MSHYNHCFLHGCICPVNGSRAETSKFLFSVHSGDLLCFYLLQINLCSTCRLTWFSNYEWRWKFQASANPIILRHSSTCQTKIYLVLIHSITCTTKFTGRLQKTTKFTNRLQKTTKVGHRLQNFTDTLDYSYWHLFIRTKGYPKSACCIHPFKADIWWGNGWGM